MAGVEGPETSLPVRPNGERKLGREVDAPRSNAVDREEQATVAYDLIPAVWARLLYGAVFLIVLALLIIDVVGISDWAIDNSTIALIVILAFLPLPRADQEREVRHRGPLR